MRILMGLGLMASLSGGIRGATAQEIYSENQIGIFGGKWIGEDFLSRSITIVDPVLGTTVYSSALNQGNAALIGVQYTGFFSRYFGADVSVAYASGDWSTQGGRIENGVLIGETVVIPGVRTVPMALNGLFRIPIGSSLPSPFITAGLGGVFFQFQDVTAPLQIPATVGTPIDTLLFDLKLGLRVAPNVGGGLMYDLTDRLALRAEGRLWATLIRERLNNESITQKNKWFMMSVVLRL